MIYLISPFVGSCVAIGSAASTQSSLAQTSNPSMFPPKNSTKQSRKELTKNASKQLSKVVQSTTPVAPPHLKPQVKSTTNSCDVKHHNDQPVPILLRCWAHNPNSLSTKKNVNLMLEFLLIRRISE